MGNKKDWQNSAASVMSNKPSDFLIHELMLLLGMCGYKSYLDVGCHNGRLMKYLLEVYSDDTYGLDLLDNHMMLVEVNTFAASLSLSDRAFETDYSRSFKDVLPVDSVDVVFLWRVVHLLDQNTLKNLLGRSLKFVDEKGVVIVTVRKFSEEMLNRGVDILNTEWKGVYKASVGEDHPERLYFADIMSLYDYLQVVCPGDYIFDNIFSHSFKELESKVNEDDPDVEADMFCIGLKKLNK